MINEVNPELSDNTNPVVDPRPRTDSSERFKRVDEDPTQPRVPTWVKIAGIAAFALSVLTYYLRLDKVAGLMGDDAWYVLLGKAIATGQGHTIINSPTPGILPLYPPGFPLLLSLAFRLAPNFPENVWLLKSVSIVAMLAVGVMAYRYFLNDRRVPAGVALGIAAVTVFCPPLVFLATSSVMSDCVFMFFFLATVVAVEKCVKAKGAGRRELLWALLVGALGSYTFLTRSIAIPMIGAAVFYLLKARMLRAAAIVCVVSALVCGPWIIYTRVHAPTPAQQLEQGGNIVFPYTYQFWQRLAGDWEMGTVTARELPKRVEINLLEISGRDVARILATLIFEVTLDPYKEAQDFFKKGNEQIYRIPKQTLWFSHVLTLIVLIGLFKVARERITFAELAVPLLLLVVVLWPFETVRYVLPLAPFVVFYFLNGLRAVQQWVQRRMAPRLELHRWALAAVGLVLMLAMHLYGNLAGQVSSTGSSVQGSRWVSNYEEIETAVRWLDQTVPKSEIIVSTNPALLHLLTGRKTIAWEDPPLRWELWKKLSVRYMSWFMAYPQPPTAGEAPFKIVYMSRDGSYLRVLDLGPVEGRPNWGVPASTVTK